MIGIHIAKTIEPMAPSTPICSFDTVSHDKKMWRMGENAAKYAMTMFLLWACRYIWNVKENTKENMMGMNQREIVPAMDAIDSSWPRRRRIGVVKMKRGRRRVEHTSKTIHDLCR